MKTRYSIKHKSINNCKRMMKKRNKKSTLPYSWKIRWDFDSESWQLMTKLPNCQIYRIRQMLYKANLPNINPAKFSRYTVCYICSKHLMVQCICMVFFLFFFTCFLIFHFRYVCVSMRECVCMCVCVCVCV